MLAFMGINWATPLLLLAVYGGVRYFVRTRPKETGINWTPLESVAVTLAIYFGAQFVGVLAIYLIPLTFGVSQDSITGWLDHNAYGQFLLVLVVEALTLLLLVKFMKRRRASIRTIGLKGRPTIQTLGYVVTSYGVYLIMYLVLLGVLRAVVPSINTDQQQVLGFDNASGLQLPFVFMSLVILPPVVEELVVRGFLYSGLKKGLPIVWAATITSALFSMAHLQAGSGEPLLWSAALDTFVLSFVLIYLKEKTGNLWASIGLHTLKNGVAFLALFVFHWV